MSAAPRPLIGISCELKPPDPRRSFSRKKEISVLNCEYASAIERAGGIPYPIPFVETEPTLRDIVARLDGLILSGGSDVVSPGDDYRGDRACQKRSEHETALLRLAEESSLPLLGICRGLQQINVFHGGTLWPDLPAWNAGAVDHRRGKKEGAFRHSIRLEAESALGRVIGASVIEINSYHHQAAKKVGSGLKVVALAEDNVIEAVEGIGDRLIWAVQWHPERMGEHSAGSKLLEHFVSFCAK
jgi:putative glutamine amidotransferase